MWPKETLECDQTKNLGVSRKTNNSIEVVELAASIIKQSHEKM